MAYFNKVHVLNLPYRVDRRYYMMGHLHTIGVDPNIIDFFPAKYHADFDSPEAIIAAAIADGFPEFGSERYEGISKWPHGKFELVCNWNHAAVLRKIIEDDRVALYMLDDYVLKIQFEYLRHVVNHLETNYPPFYLLQLGWWTSPSHEEWMMSHGLVNRPYADEDIINGFIARGIGGCGDWVTVMSPKGAEILLDNIVNPSGSPPEYFFGTLSRPDRDKTGLFHFIKPIVDGVPVNWKEDSINIYGRL